MSDETTNTQPTPAPARSNTPMYIAVSALLVVAVAGFFMYFRSGAKQDDTSDVAMTGDTSLPADNGQTSAPTDGSTEAVASAYKDGTYSADGKYVSPGGPETIGITLTIKDGIITDAVGKVESSRPESIRRQTMFVNGFKAQIVGKSLAEVSLSKVSGSSLSPKGFNDAVAQIKVQAAA